MPTKRIAFWILLFLIVLAGGVSFRLWRLGDRPMHTDEAVHAEKFEALLKKGFYRYDPSEFHGPTLNYFTLVSARMRGEATYPEIDEATLRIVPAVFGILLMLSPFFFIDGLNKRSVLFCTMLLAFSPAFVFYSRYYIQEMQLVCFTAFFLGSLWRSIRSGKLIWFLLSGVFLGLMHASKETFVFSIIAAVAALIACASIKQNSFKIKYWHLAAGLCAAIMTSVLFYSSFGSNWQGVVDSVTTYAVWFKRAGGQSVHVHPWYYYLDLLTWLEFFEPLTWNEDVMVVLSVIGIFFAFNRRAIYNNKPALIYFWAIYTVVLTMIYCLIPYKTPWCMLSFLFGMAILSGFVLDWLIGISQTRWKKMITGGLIVVFVLVSPIFQSWMLNFRYFEKPSNPYVYAHTSNDVYEMVERIGQAASVSENGKDTLIQIVAAGDDYWPLPWYLRTFTRVGYHNKMDASVCDAPIIIANALQEQEILETLYSAPKPGERHLYMPLFEEPVFLRPGVQWQGYIRKQLLDEMQRPSTLSTGQDLITKESFMQAGVAKKEIKDMLKFSHRAMNADFEVFIQHDDGTYAGRAARAAFNEVDRLEKLLSRYIENSDISRINRLEPGQSELVSEDTMQCLLIARQAHDLTGGAFDITIGTWIDHLKNKNAILPKEKQPCMEQLKLDPNSLTVHVLDKNISVDLGGIGKGYAVDTIAHILQEWGVKKALIHGGASSVRALEPPVSKKGWPVTLSGPTDGKTVVLLEMAEEVLSCSGLQRDEHIINPFTGKSVKDRRACWIRLHQNAALADTLSTAGMIMSLEAVSRMQDNLEGCSVMILAVADGAEMKWVKLGEWPTE